MASKLMSKREMALFRTAMHYAIAYYGVMGITIDNETIANDIITDCGYKFDEDDVAECCENITGS